MQTSLPSSAIKPQVAARFTYVEPDKVLQRLTCPVCLEPFVEPRRTPCKHTFCQGCITFIAAQPNAACPSCRAAVSNAKLESVDEALVLELLGELVVYCTNKARQCDWKGPRANLREHLERTCERVACRYGSRACSFSGKASVVQKHELECEYGDAPCALKCGYVGQRRLQSEHQENCPVYLKQQEEARKKAEEEAQKRREQAEAEEKRDRELQQLYDSLNPAAENVLHLNVGGQHFQTSRGVLCREPQSVLAGLITTKRPLQRDNAGVVFLDLDPVAFGHILAWLRTGVVPRRLELDQRAVVLETAERLKLEALIAMLRVEPEKNPPLTQVELLHLVKKNCPSIQLPGVNLSGLCLYGLDLTKANLANANLVNANLTNAILANVDLTNANLTNANLSNANLENANLTNANLTNVNLTNAVGKAIVRGVNLTGANLSGRDFRGVDLTNANLTKAKLSNANLASANLANADLAQANLTDAQLPYANLGNANLVNANLTNANIFNAVLAGSNLSGVDLSGRDFGRRDLSNANLINANLTNANLANAHLTNANLTNANLLNADLTNASLYHANLTDANLNNANLTGASLTNANLTNTSLTNANLTGANLTNASIDKAYGSYRLHA